MRSNRSVGEKTKKTRKQGNKENKILHDLGTAQLELYVEAYNNTALPIGRNGKVSEISFATKGTNLNKYIREISTAGVTSLVHPGKQIRYYTYADDPGMIYYGYVNEPKKDPATVPVPEKQKEENNQWSKALAIGGLIGTAAAIAWVAFNDFTGVGVGDDALLLPLGEAFLKFCQELAGGAPLFTSTCLLGNG